MLFFVLKIGIEIIFLGISVIFISILCSPKPKPKAPSAVGAPPSSHGSVISDKDIKKSLKQQKKPNPKSITTPQIPPAHEASAPSAVAAFKRATKQCEDTKPNSEKSAKNKTTKSTKEVSSNVSAKNDASPDISEEHDLNPIVSSKEEKADGNNND
uniref:Uncharacterized protein n=1 Tax=Panagrolaimus davidi TaxID=227884 RepID=A0A914QC62_9BILA